MNTLERWLPIVGTLREYDGATFRGDLIAGLTTAVMLVPQGMAYAMLANLPPVYGLYASLIPLMIYAIFGTSRQLAVGPVAMVSLLIAAGVGALATPGNSDFVVLAIVLSALVGAMQLGMGLLRLGFLVNFLSHPVISGFTSAAAIIIGLSQLKHVLGVKIERSPYVHEVVSDAASKLGQANTAAVVIGLGGVAVLVLLKRFAPRVPRALVVVVAGTLIAWLVVGEAGVAVVGAVPAGLPTPTVPAFSWDSVQALWPLALTISLVGFMESIAVAKRYARQNNYRVDANQELVGLGMANVAGALFQASPVTGGFSRTAVNADAGARTNMAGFMTAVLVGLTLLALTPLFYFLPKAVLAAIILAAVFGLIDWREAIHLWKVKKSDFAMLIITFLSTLTLGIEIGIMVGVGASVGMFLFRTTRPHIAVLGRVPGTTEFRNVQRFAVEPVEGHVIVRLDSQLYFANINFVTEALERSGWREPSVSCVVLDASGINQLDASGEQALRDIFEDCKGRGVRCVLAGVKGPVRDVLLRSHFLQNYGDDAVAMTVAIAVGLDKDCEVAPFPETVRHTA